MNAQPITRLGLALSMLGLLWTSPALAEGAAPRAVVALFETARLTLPQGPLPDGLRFVLYDDGQVIARSGPTDTDPDPAGRGVTYGKLAPVEAEAFRSEALSDLQGIASPHSGLAAAADVGSTILEIWDGARYRRFSANAWPCQAEGRVFTGGWQRNREATDPQFRKVCDRLMQYRIVTPQPFRPKAVKLMIGAMEDPPEQKVPWPKDWPAAPADLKPKAAAPFCAPVSADPEAFANRLIAARWDSIDKTALVIDSGTAAVIWDWYFDLPAPIPMISEAGAPEAPVGAECASAAAR